MKRVFIMGGEGVGMVAASIVDQLPDMEMVGFINDVEEKGTHIGKYKAFPVVGPTEDIPDILEAEDAYIFNGFLGLTREKLVYEKIARIGVPKERLISVIHPTAVIPEDFCRVGSGVLFAPYSQLSPDVTVGDNCFLLGNSFVGHDTVLEEHVSLATNAVVGAYVRIGRGAHIGINASVKEKITIGEFSVIGMGAVVVKDVPDNSIVVGNPARLLRHKQ